MAPIVAKCCENDARVSRVVAASVACVLLQRDAAVKAATASRIAIAVDAVGRLLSQITLPNPSTAHMPT